MAPRVQMLTPMERVFRWFSEWGMTVLGLCVCALGLALHFGPYSTVRTNGMQMAPALTDGGYYLEYEAGPICRGDTLTVALDDDGREGLRMLMAVAGDTVSLTASGYRVGDEDIVMGETWIRAASEKIDETGLTLEPGQIMLRLRAPSDGGAENPFWIARARDVHSVLVRSLFRTDAGFWSPVERGAGPCVEMPE